MKILLCLMLIIAFPYTLAATFDTYTDTISLGTQASLSWKVVGSQAKFLVEKTVEGHVAFGIGSSMDDADIVVIEKGANNVLTLKDCKLVGHQTPVCGETSEDWKFADSATPSNSYVSTDSMMKAEIVRNLAGSGKDGDKDIKKGGNSFLFSHTTSKTLAQHNPTGGRGTVSLTFSAGATSSTSSFALLVKAAICSTLFVFYLAL